MNMMVYGLAYLIVGLILVVWWEERNPAYTPRERIVKTVLVTLGWLPGMIGGIIFLAILILWGIGCLVYVSWIEDRVIAYVRRHNPSR